MENANDRQWEFMGFDFYKEPNDGKKWLPCSECGVTPRIWVFDNGRTAMCVCGTGRYNHKHTVKAKPIGYYVRKTGGFKGYNADALRKNWNKYVKNLPISQSINKINK